ncbi:hypothetical protein ASG49_00160 [Marmoricola sp. Leaf446]|nr:hypothetical protein ASG49_00160 [Marmoricola sp. Leaf446]
MRPAPVPTRPSKRSRGAVVALSTVLLGGAAGVGGAWALGPGDGTVVSALQRSGPGREPAVAGTQAAAAAAVLPSVVQVRSDRGSGSGFVFDRLGHVLTNQHVVDGDRSLLLQLDGGRQVRAALVGEDEANDIAVLRADPEDLPAAAMGDSSTVRIGEPVIAIGSPLGLSGTVTAGIVSTTAREARLGSSSRQAVIQTDASINPGNSGGPLVDLDGRVVGVNTAIATVPGTGSGNIGIGFAVPIDRALRVAEGILPD